MGKVLLASPRGYCAGVDRAVQTVELALQRFGAPIYVRKEIVHNKFVVQTLMEKGAVFVSELDEVPAGARVVFSAHGVAPTVYEAAATRNLEVIDATCPLVTKVHREARRFADQGYNIILIGHQGHEEVEGTLGQAPDRIHVIDTDGDVSALPDFRSQGWRPIFGAGTNTTGTETSDTSDGGLTGRAENPMPVENKPVVWLSQTTLSVDQTTATVERLHARYPNLISPPSDDICFATQNRQGAVKAIAPQSDVVVVVGSANSSNSVRLLEVALESGATAAYRVDRATELDPDWFTAAKTVGVTSGASVPEILVTEVLEWLAARGFTQVEEVTTAAETTAFSLPKSLR